MERVVEGGRKGGSGSFIVEDGDQRGEREGGNIFLALTFSTGYSSDGFIQVVIRASPQFFTHNNV